MPERMNGGAADPADPKDVMLVVFHRDCLDGFTAAWAVRRMAMKAKVPIEIMDAAYGDAPPDDIQNRHVLIVDFSYPRAQLEAMAEAARSVTVLDHHRTAQQALEGLPEPLPFKMWTRKGYGIDQVARDGHKLTALFDMERSGAGLTFDFFFPGENRIRLINYVEDRDLWRKRIKGTDEVNAFLATYPFDFTVWDRIAEVLEDQMQRGRVLDVGQALLRQKARDIERTLTTCAHETTLDGHVVPCANVPAWMASDAGHVLASKVPDKFAITYFDRGDGMRIWSLRSGPDGMDVSEIAKKFGGGGHAHAAGFQSPISEERDSGH